MDKLACPWMFLGPSGSGKLTKARRWIEEANGISLPVPLETLTFTIGDGYEAKVLASPYHFEIDIPNLSMQDKQIIGDLLTMFLSSSDVLSSLRTSARKLVILRRAHSLSLPAAIRVRAVLQQYVLPAQAPGMIWITAREITGPLSLFDDIFVPVRVPRLSLDAWNSKVPELFQNQEAWTHLEGHPERAHMMAQFSEYTPLPWPRRIQDFYDEMILKMIAGAKKYTQADMTVVEWIRTRVYDCLSFCQTGPEIIDSCAAGIARNAHHLGNADLFWNCMKCLTNSEPHTSYRTPLSLEWAFLRVFEEMRKNYAPNNGSVPETFATKSKKIPETGTSPSPAKKPTKRRTNGPAKAGAGSSMG
jgi:hypothetical protein